MPINTKMRTSEPKQYLIFSLLIQPIWTTLSWFWHAYVNTWAYQILEFNINSYSQRNNVLWYIHFIVFRMSVSIRLACNQHNLDQIPYLLKVISALAENIYFFFTSHYAKKLGTYRPFYVFILWFLNLKFIVFTYFLHLNLIAWIDKIRILWNLSIRYKVICNTSS